MLAAGVPLTLVSRQFGHANANVTAQAHTHLREDSRLDEAPATFAGPGFGPEDALGHGKSRRPRSYPRTAWRTRQRSRRMPHRYMDA
jgi:hypothetical protein